MDFRPAKRPAGASQEPVTATEVEAMWRRVLGDEAEVGAAVELAQILPMVDFSQDAYTNGTVTSGGQTTTIAGFQGGPVYPCRQGP